jgi:hypothetical protein
MYAVQQRRLFPDGKRDDGGELVFQVSSAFERLVVEHAGNNKTVRGTSLDLGNATGSAQWGVVPRILIDPTFKDFGFHDSRGWLIGYNYLAGKPYTTWNNSPPNTPAGEPGWESPLGLTKVGSGDMFACLNDWVDGGDGQRCWVAHAEGGALGEDAATAAYWYLTVTPDPRVNGTRGGNVAQADGSVGWKPIERMRAYYAACYADHADAQYQALW